MKLECTEIEELTGAYFADQLTVQERYRVEMHLIACPACAAELSDFAPLAAALKQEFDSEEQELTLDARRRESLLSVWNQHVPVQYSDRSKYLTLRRAAVALTAAASVLIASYLGFGSDHQTVQPDTLTLEIAAQPATFVAPALSSDSTEDPDYGMAFTGIPYADIVRIVRTELPEYGMGSTVFASRYRVSPTRAPYIGLPVPRLNYDFDEASLGNK
ncbi:MAG: zf-HC2 domain-containing protein [Candidatus Hydrogenedentota bacterium]